MQILRCCQLLIVLFILAPSILFGIDLPDYVKYMFHGIDLPRSEIYHGKLIDADTLEPIEGAVVSVVWSKCRPGIGSGSCTTGPCREALTDANGDWEIAGPKPNNDPGLIRSIIGFLIPWNESPQFTYYKPGYFPFDVEVYGEFSAFPYMDKAKNIEGIVLTRIGDNEEQAKQYMEQWKKDRCDTLIPAKNPEQKLRELDFDFKYPKNTKRIYVRGDRTRYEVLGLKRAVTPEEKMKARSLGSKGIPADADLPLLSKALGTNENPW